jgi:hypothetical protein
VPKLASTALGGLLLLSLVPATSSAADAPAKKGGACKADRARLCAGIKGRDAIRACMLTHRESLSPKCRSTNEKAEAAKTDCAADAAKLCAEVNPGHGRTMACLIGRKTDLQPACRKHVDIAVERFLAKRKKRSATPAAPASPGKP